MKTRYIPGNMALVKDEPKYGIEIYADYDRLSAIGYLGKAFRPAFNYRFQTREHLDRYIEKTYQNWMADRVYRENRKLEKQNAIHNFHTALKEGDILAGSWGWEQTNWDIYRVVRVLSPRRVEIAKANRKTEETHFMQGTYTVQPGHHGETLTKTIGVSVYDGKTHEKVRLHECCDLYPTDQTVFHWTAYA